MQETDHRMVEALHPEQILRFGRDADGAATEESDWDSDRENRILTWICQGLYRYAAELVGYTLILFGSRACRTHQERSDFDIGIYGDEPVSFQTFYKIGDFFESLPTLHRIDWVDLNRTSMKFQENALKNGVILYEQSRTSQ